jgi:hypothetical protein
MLLLCFNIRFESVAFHVNIRLHVEKDGENYDKEITRVSRNLEFFTFYLKSLIEILRLRSIFVIFQIKIRLPTCNVPVINSLGPQVVCRATSSTTDHLETLPTSYTSLNLLPSTLEETFTLYCEGK